MKIYFSSGKDEGGLAPGKEDNAVRWKINRKVVLIFKCFDCITRKFFETIHPYYEEN